MSLTVISLICISEVIYKIKEQKKTQPPTTKNADTVSYLLLFSTRLEFF